MGEEGKGSMEEGDKGLMVEVKALTAVAKVSTVVGKASIQARIKVLDVSVN